VKSSLSNSLLLCLFVIAVFQANQVIGLFLVTYILSHPDVVPQWLSSFEVSRFGVPQKGVSMCDNAGLRHKRDVGDMMDHMPLMNSSMMSGPMMHGGMVDGPVMHGRGRMMPGPGGMFPDGSEAVKETSADVDNGKVLPKLDDLMLPGKMMPEVGDMIPKVHDSVGVQLADVLSKPDSKVPASHNDNVDDDDRRGLIMPIGSQVYDTSRLHNHMDYASKHRIVGLSAGEYYFLLIVGLLRPCIWLW